MTPESMIATLDAGVPVALLPVRLETRFLNGATELRVRVYPEPLHIDTHEPELTAAEVTAGQAYWNQRWAAPADTARATSAWNELVRSIDPRRGLWIVESLTPTNLAQLGTAAPPVFPAPPGKLEAWTRAARAALMPRQWLVVLVRNGTEVCRKAGAPLPDTLVVGPDPNAVDEPAPPDALPLDDATRWLADYDAAVAIGMGITILDADVNGGLASGFDELIVIGVDGARSPAAGSAAIAELILAHLHTDGLGMLRPGTPTNNTEAARTGDPDPAAALARELDPANSRPLSDDSAGRALERALGLARDAAGIAHAPLANQAEPRTTSLLLDVLWPSTLGYYLDQLLDPLVDDATIEQLRAFARIFLQPAGPLPVLRVGKQPYGVLPILAPSRLPAAAAGGIADRLHGLLLRLRPFWNAAAGRVPRLGATGDPDTELLQLLQLSPQSAVARFRRVIGPELEPNTQGLAPHARAQQYFASLVLQLALGSPSMPRVASFTADPRDHQLRVPWVQKVLGDAPLEPDYLTTIAQIARSTGGRALLDQRNNSGTLLEALVANATLNELDHAAARIVTEHQLKLGTLTAKPARVAFRSPEAVRIASPTPAPSTPGSPGPVRVDTPRDLHQLVLPLTTGTETVGDWIAARVRAGTTPPTVLHDLAAFLDHLEELATRPAAEIDRALRGVLDSFSHRLDAWYTSLATARLEALRQQRPLGIQVGGYGWVEGLHPDTTPDSLGYLHAPSLEQASAAAILRSGHLAHRDTEHQALNLDLRSDRVRLALELLEGVARGQPLAALLGYRLERSLRDRDPRLARFIAPLRRLAPLRPIAPDDTTVVAEAIAARDVVDGVGLLERWRASRDGVLDAINVPGTDERVSVSAELDRLADTLDAVSDLLVAESVYQTTAGNPERARAALAVLDRQERPIEPMVVRTPRSGNTYAQRLLLLLTEDLPPIPWSRLVDVRSAAEPRLNAWIARLLGDPARYRFPGHIVTDNKPARDVEVKLRQLALSPLSLVLAARRGGPNQPSELEERVAQLFAASLQPDDVNPRLEIDAGPPAGVARAVGLGPLLVLLEWLGNLVGQRAADARDLALAENLVDPGVDGAELAARADAAVAAFGTALRGLDAALRARQPSERGLRLALNRAAAAGAQHAVPRAVVPVAQPADLPAAVLAALLELGRAVLERMRITETALAALDASLDTTTAPADAQIEHHIARLRRLFGNDFPVLPRFTVLNPPELGASLAEQDALCAGDALAPVAWLQRMALVRPDADRLQRVFTAAELLDNPVTPTDVRIVQLPHLTRQRWAALPQDPGVSVDAGLALALHSPGTLDFTTSLAGLVCDDWAETIPEAEQTTGLSFHYDAPGARAPNTVLLAVAADPAATAWSVDELVDVVREAAALAKLRLVGPRQLDRLGVLLPTTYLPQNFKHDVPSVDMTRLTANAAAGAGVLGKTIR